MRPAPTSTAALRAESLSTRSFVPTAWLGPAVTWRDGNTPDTAIAEWAVDSHRLPVEITVGGDGRLVALAMPRWGNPDREPWGEYPCGGLIGTEADFGGLRIPTTVRAGWFFGTEKWEQGEFFRAPISTATFF